MNLIDELLYFYYVHDKFQGKYLDEKDARDYFEIAIKKGLINYVSDGVHVLGYCESWRINYEQFGRILCGIPFNIKTEDVENGNLAYVANVTIAKEHRKTSVIKELTRGFFNKNISCDYFCGEAKRKKVGLVKVFTKQKAYEKWAK